MKQCIVIVLCILLSSMLFAGKKQKKSALENPKKAIEIKGQTRNLNMMLILKSKKEKISFVRMRRNYRDEILATEP